MDRLDLQEYQEEEQELSKKALKKCTTYGFFSPRFFLEDKVHLQETYGVRLDQEIPIKLLLPFFEQIITFIRPFKTALEFEKRCGISVEDLVTLFEDNRVVPLPVGRLHLYEGLDYLDPILEKKPPSASRLISAQVFIAGGEKQLAAYYIKASAQLAGKFKNPGEKLNKITYFQNLPRPIEDQLEAESIDRYVRLCSFGYEWLAKLISEMDNIPAIYYQLGLCDATLT